MDIAITEPLGQRVPENRIFIRQCYIDLFPKIWGFLASKSRVTITLTGTPGIGKSLFGLVFILELVRFLQEKKASPSKLASFGLGLNGRIVYEFVKEVNAKPTYYLIDTEAKSISKTDENPSDWLDDEHAFLIKDGPCDDYPAHCSTVWLSSPRAGSFQKAFELAEGWLIMSPWTADELVECWKAGCAPKHLFPLPSDDFGALAWAAAKDVFEVLEDGLSEPERHEAVLRRWIAELGPVARRVFNPTKGYVNLAAALDDLSTDALSTLVKIATSQDATGESTKFKMSHRLLLMIPSPDFTAYKFVPSSVKIGHSILRMSLETDLKTAQSLMGLMSGAHLGLVFEPYAHFVLAKGGTFQIRNLTTDALTEAKLPVRVTVQVENSQLPALGLEANKYYVPTDPCFAVIDSWTLEDMFQLTASLHHPIKSTAKQFKALKGKGPKRIIFVVPKTIEGNFKAQSLVLANGKPSVGGGPKGGWNDVEQFVLGL